MGNVLVVKNRDRDKPSFANLNLLGRCNVGCYFCLGEDLHDTFGKFRHTKVHFSEWPNLPEFLRDVKEAGIRNVYITGQNTDSLLYAHLDGLIEWLQGHWRFDVGIRTNGYLAERHFKTLCKCRRSVGYSIHSLDPETNYLIMRRRDIPDWETIIPNSGERVRVQIVATRYNHDQILDIIRYAAKFPNVGYVQVRRISTDHRYDELGEDQLVFAEKLKEVNASFPRMDDFHLAPQYYMFGKRVCWWATVRTSIGSYNYYTDGTVNKDYFVIEGYEKSNGIYDPSLDQGNREMVVDPYALSGG